MKKNSMYVTTLILLIQFVFLAIVHGDADLIEKTCKQTPDHDLCVSSLKADPGSASADVKGLALIMVDVVKAKATECVNKINDLLKQTPQDQALHSCMREYDAILTADVPVAIDSLTKGVPMYAFDSMNDVANEAKSCEDNLSGRSIMTALNNDSQKIADVTAAVVKLCFDM